MKPTLLVTGTTIPEAWERALLTLHEQGKPYPGRYWREGDPVGRQATMVMRIERVCGEPRVHRGFTCTPEDLWDYRREMLEGSERDWEYTYHSRAFQWDGQVDQFAYAMDCLCRKWDSHKAVISTAHPREDCVGAGDGTHIPCLRSISFELEDEHERYVLNMYTHWRARNAIHASFNNMFGLSFLVEKGAEELSGRLDKPVVPGGYVDQSDDFHYNGKDAMFLETLLAQSERPPESRYWTTAELLEMID